MSLRADACKQCVRNDLLLRSFPVFKHYYSQPLTSINLQLNVIVSGVESQKIKKKKPLPVHFFHLFLFFSSSWGSCLDTDTHTLSASTPPPSPHPLRSSIKHTAASWCQFFMQRCEVIALERPGLCPSTLPLSFYSFVDDQNLLLFHLFPFYSSNSIFYSSA